MSSRKDKKDDNEPDASTGLITGSGQKVKTRKAEDEKRAQEDADKKQKDRENPGELQRKQQDEAEKRGEAHAAVTVDVDGSLITERLVTEEEKKEAEERNKQAQTRWDAEQQRLKAGDQQFGQTKEERKS